MKRLQEVSTRLGDDSDPAGLLLEIVDAAIAITAADMGNIQLFDQVSESLRIVASRGFEAPFLEHFNAVHDGQGSCGSAARRGGRAVIGDVTTSPVFAGTPDLAVMLAAGERAVQSTPLVSRSGRLVGMLSTHYRTPRLPVERDLHIVDLLARQAADWIERLQAAEELRNAKETAEAASRAKDEFLANVSHEIRTPFGAILGMTELVLETPLTGDQRQYLQTVKSAADNLLGLVEELLDFEKIGAGKLELAPADFLLRPMMADALRALGVRAQKKGLELAWDAGPDVPDALVGDAVRLRQVLHNLVGNAIKFTKHGEVAVRVKVADGSARRGGRPPLHGGRHRHRHPDRRPGADLPGVRAGRQLHHARVRRHRVGPDHRFAAGGPDGRRDRRGERAGQGQHFTFTARIGQRHTSAEGGVARPSDSTHEAAASAPAVGRAATGGRGQ